MTNLTIFEPILYPDLLVDICPSPSLLVLYLCNLNAPLRNLALPTMPCACSLSTSTASEAMSCSLNHDPPDFLSARYAAQRPDGALASNASGHTLMHFAARRDDVDTVRLTLSRGASPLAPSASAATPLTLAAGASAVRAMDAMLAAGDVRRSFGAMNAVLVAAAMGHVGMVRMMLGRLEMEKLYLVYPYSETLVDFAAESPVENVEMLEALREMGEEPDWAKWRPRGLSDYLPLISARASDANVSYMRVWRLNRQLDR